MDTARSRKAFSSPISCAIACALLLGETLGEVGALVFGLPLLRLLGEGLVLLGQLLFEASPPLGLGPGRPL